MANKNQYRPDQNGTFRSDFERAKKKIYATQTICGICGKPVDFSIKYPDPMSPCIDHIIPIAKGGHPSDPDNLQLAHRKCNRAKGTKLMGPGNTTPGNTTPSKSAPLDVDSNRVLPLSFDWKSYKAS